MKANPNRFWIIVILLGWAFDFLFWKKPLGINFVIYVILCLATGIFLLRVDGLRLARGSSLLLLPVAFLAAMTFIRLEPMTVFLSIVAVLFLKGVFALTYLNGQWARYALLDYIFGFFRLFGSMIARPLGFAAENRREQQAESPKRSAYVWPVLRGIVIALPVIAIFASLLSSADPIFAKRLEDFIKVFKIENLPEYIFRLVYILVFAYALAGTFLHAAQKSDEAVEEKTRVSPFLGFTESTIVLGSVVILFIAFVVIQFQYFFGGQVNMLGLLLIAFVFLEISRRERAVGLGMVLAALGFIVSLSILNVDSFIVKQNIQREIRGVDDKAFTQGRADLDAQYFLDLSDDAVPSLVSAFQTKSVPVAVKEKIGASLACIRYTRNQDTRKYPWQSFHFSRYYADSALSQVKKDLDTYKIIDKDMPVKVETPSGIESSCYQYYYD